MVKCGVPMAILWLMTLLLSTCPSHSLNLDDRSSTIVRSGLPPTTEDDVHDDGFGWAIAQHRLTNGTYIFLISAIRGNGTSVSDEGVIYVCPYNIFEGCRPNHDFGLNNSLLFPSFLDAPVNIRGQLLGFTLKSFGDRVLASAPYQRQVPRSSPSDTFAFNGRFVTMDGALNRSSLLNFYSSFFDTYQVVGIDAAVIRRDSVDRYLVNNFFGTSVFDTGTGTTYEIEFEIAAGGLVRDAEDPGSSGGPLQVYRGYSMDTGYFTTTPGSSDSQMVISSPRGQSHLGYVEVINADFTAIQRITGDEVDGYFGYDLAVTTFDQTSGYQSLVVGCPLCRTDSGRVYVYVHTSNPGQPFKDTAPQVLNSPSTSRGRFGIGVEAIGDVDLDGFTDVAISAPYLDNGVVYVYRGSASGLVADTYQVIRPQYPAFAFGFSMSGGLDIDRNGYPDLTVADLRSKNISTIRGSPLVNVTTTLLGTRVLDILGDASKLCPEGDVLLNCFNVTPCFYYNAIEGNVSRFALKYNISADITLKRVGVYENGMATAQNSILSDITINGPGEGYKACGDVITFALYENLLDPASILVSIMVEDVDDPIALEEEPSLAQFGAPLHPTLLRYTKGDLPARTRFDYPITFNINCTAGNASVCEGMLVSTGSLNLTMSAVEDVEGMERVIVSHDNMFTVDVVVTNDGMDTSLGSVFDIEVPPQIEISAASTRCSSRTGNGTLIECPLKDAIAAGGSSFLSISFTFNDTSAFLGQESFNISLSARDGGTSTVFSRQVLMIPLDLLGRYQLVTSVAQAEYSSYKSVRSFSDTSAISLDRIGPSITYTALIQNSLNGTVFPRSTLRVYIPTDVKQKDEFVPLLIPTSVLVGTGTDSINCSQYQSFSELLPVNQQPGNYLPSWTGTPPPNNSDCEKSGMFRCGVIICTVLNLMPLPAPPLQVNVFARLYSPAVDESIEVSIYATLSRDTAQPRLALDSVNSTSTQFSVVPGPRDVARECIRYWVVVVSVVIGIFVLLGIIVILMMCNVFRRWYKGHQQDMMGDEQIDSEISYHRRTIPPISGMSNGTSPTPESNSQSVEQRSGGASMSDKEREKDEEAQRELDDLFPGVEMAERSRKSTSSASVTFDPSKGLDFDGGEETEI